MSFDIRDATSEDAGQLTTIAHAAKRHWGYSEEWIRLWRDDLTVTEEAIQRHTVRCAVADDGILGFYAVSQQGSEFELEHMWVDPGRMGSGVGAALFEHARAMIAERGGGVLRIASDPNAEGFYLKLGARRVGEESSKPSGRSLPLLEIRVSGNERISGSSGPR